jgi:ankyrin repeat protein
MQDTDLYKAVKRGDLITIRHLLSAGVDPNGAPGLGTPLSAAAARGNTSVITLLLDAGRSLTSTPLRSRPSAITHRPYDFCSLPAGRPKGQLALS